MKTLRSITRRGFSVGTAGWFTVLRPNTWFPASRLPVGFRSPVIRSTSSGSSGALDHAVPPGPALIVPAPEQHPLRMAVVVLAAIAITSALLWWIMHP